MNRYTAEDYRRDRAAKETKREHRIRAVERALEILRAQDGEDSVIAPAIALLEADLRKLRG